MPNLEPHALIVRLVESQAQADIGTVTLAVPPGPASMGGAIARALGRLFHLQPNLPIDHQLAVPENARAIADLQQGRTARPLILEVTQIHLKPAADPARAAGRAQASETKSLDQIADSLRAYGQHVNGNDPKPYVQAIRRLGQERDAAADIVRAIGLKLNLPGTAGAAAFADTLRALMSELEASKEQVEIQAYDLQTLNEERASLSEQLRAVRADLDAMRETVRLLEAERDLLRSRAGQAAQEPAPQPAPRNGRI